MPYLYDPNGNGMGYAPNEVRERDYGYNYPEMDGAQLNLRPGSVLHERIVKEVMQRARLSYRCMQNRHDSWNTIDKTLTAYVQPDDAEEKVQKKDPRKPVSIVIPMSYAVLDTLVTYMVTTYLNEAVLFKLDPTGPEDVKKASLFELVLAQQCWRYKHGLALHTMWRDSLAYGIGITSPVWNQTFMSRRVQVPTRYETLSTGETVVKGYESVRERKLRFEGNRIETIDPYNYLPDPSVPAHKIQQGEFVGWLVHDNYVGLLDKETSERGYFNCKYLKHTSGVSSLIPNDASKRDRDSVQLTRSDATTRPVDVIYMVVNLIPRDWGLGTSESPEKWIFGVGSDCVVVMANPMDLDHDMFPVAVCAPDTDGYAVSPISRLEILSGMQTTIDWLISSHVTNIRKAINDMLIVDPSLINMKDLEDPQPGKLIRTRRPMWGKGVENAVKQLSVNDITRQHISDATVLTDIMQKVGAAPDTLQGIMRSGGERRSATESRDTRVSAFSRVEKLIILANLQAMTDLGLMMASQTQQFMSQDTYVKILGEWPKQLAAEYGVAPGELIRVTPDDLNILFDVRISDGSPQGGEFLDSWIQIFQIAATNPTVWNSLDGVRMFMHIARLAGTKNIYEFVAKGGSINPQVMPDELAIEQAKQGNLVPMNPMMQGGGGM